tara:strand:+ start:518 stop:1186 length:669 start_codon:yes stop_codon:yes gene_type:complete
LSNKWIKLSLAVSLDGKICFPNDKKLALGGKGDRKLLEEALSWSDATLMGAETLRIHQNTCLINNKDLIKDRRLKKKEDQPISIIICRKYDFKSDWEYFQQPIKRWLISPFEMNNNQYNIFDKYIFDNGDLSKKIKLLRESGLNKILVLGGSKLIYSLLLEDQLDELQLTLVPIIIGSKNNWISNNKIDLPIDLSKKEAWKLKRYKSLDENELMISYTRNRS